MSIKILLYFLYSLPYISNHLILPLVYLEQALLGFSVISVFSRQNLIQYSYIQFNRTTYTMPTVVKKGQKPLQSSYASQHSNNQQPNQDSTDKAQLTEKWDINLKHIAQNIHTMERIHTLTSVLAGVIAGILNTNLYSGIFTYLFFHILMSALVSLKVDKINNYFLKKSDLLNGLGSGVLVFICCWIIIYNIVYTL